MERERWVGGKENRDAGKIEEQGRVEDRKADGRIEYGEKERRKRKE